MFSSLKTVDQLDIKEIKKGDFTYIPLWDQVN